MRLKRHNLGQSFNGNVSFTFRAKTPIKILEIADHPEGTSLFYLEQDDYRAEQDIEGRIVDEEDTINDYERYDFVGAAHGKCVFLQAFNNEMTMPNNNTADDIVRTLEIEGREGRLDNLVNDIGDRITNYGITNYGITNAVEQIKIQALSACSQEFESSLKKSYAKVIKEHEELSKKINTLNDKINELNDKINELKNNTSLKLVESLAKELGYEKDFVDNHPF